MNGYLKSKAGTRITGTLERIPATQSLRFVSKGEDGKLTFNFNTGSTIFWDGQVTVEREGQMVFLDENGKEFLESEVEFVESDEIYEAEEE
jgi:hypothetical protein